VKLCKWENKWKRKGKNKERWEEMMKMVARIKNGF